MEKLTPSKTPNLTIGILSYGNLATLENSVHSWIEGGLLDEAHEIIIYFNALSKQDKAFAKKHHLKCLGSGKNLGISVGIQSLINEASGDYFLLLQNDWELVEKKEVTRSRLHAAASLLKDAKANCIRLRHAQAFGAPLHTLQFKNAPLKSPKHILDSVHYLPDPSQSLPDYIQKETIKDEHWFFASSKNASYTNNPCLYKTSFLKNLISGNHTCELGPDDKKVLSDYANSRGLTTEQVNFESIIQNSWESEDHVVAQSSGLFMHHPLAESGSVNRLNKTPLPDTTTYDFIFSLGYGCSCSHHLRSKNLQKLAYPYDWVLNNQSIEEMAIPFFTNFKKNFSYSNLEKVDSYNYPKTSCQYVDTQTNIVSVHDFTPDGDFLAEAERFTSKQRRRSLRLISKIESSEKILIVYEDPHRKFQSTDFHTLVNQLNERFPGKCINLLHIQYNLDIKQVSMKRISSRVFFAEFDNTPDQSDPSDAWVGNQKNWHTLLSHFALNEVVTPPKSKLRGLRKLFGKLNTVKKSK
jgi:hypothetical protein